MKYKKLLVKIINEFPVYEKGAREFHISRSARDKYQFDYTLFTLRGNVIYANFHAARIFAQKINDLQNKLSRNEKTPKMFARAGDLNAMGLMDEIYHYVIELYRQNIKNDVFASCLHEMENTFGKSELENIFDNFMHFFPPANVYQGKENAREYIEKESEGIPHREILLEEMILLWLTNKNPAYKTYQELFLDTGLEKKCQYKKIISHMDNFFQNNPPFGPESQYLIEMLLSPQVNVPYSIQGQLEYIKDHWGYFLGKFLSRLLGSLDFIKEENKWGGFGPGQSLTMEFGDDDEPERFSPDSDWMMRTVMIAKSVYVWLDQLSKKYNQNIYRLDQIPDEELQILADWGFTALWLIGLWQRSEASKRIKRLCGNPEAEASAYSLYDYVISWDLGGYEALINLKQRAMAKGIRLASDMVPNHTGLDSKWMHEHPDWFLSLPYCPFPSYSFNGENYSNVPGVGIYIEDHYYTRSDAAVVFKRYDFNSGDERFIYHGNDGTSMPWNDTAQLNYLNPEVRESVIQTILHVARMFPIIRFDAAMTLAKKHYQRLWFPIPGSGGDIPTRSDHGMSKQDFDKCIPDEFWREVVDRVAQEVPDTLLLAEAFWLMEGYFVRTLGMHRVYNSAFMNMLKNEDNKKYRYTIKNVLEYNPQILKRFVNFMNNPDEETAVAQFGKGDKYLGICLLMATLPGLPMFGHGQIEGFGEKYGMEYRRAYWDEQVDWDLVKRHEKHIFPLLRKRYLFSDVINFYLYDFYTNEGNVNENVFAYSNSYYNEKALIVYHNKYEHTAGKINWSAGHLTNSSGDIQQKSLADVLGLHNDNNYYCIFRDQTTNLQYIRNNRSIFENGLYIELGAYQFHVFMDFYEIPDNEWNHYAHLHSHLHGKGVSDIELALKELFLTPLHYAFKNLINKGMLAYIIDKGLHPSEGEIDQKMLDEVEDKVCFFFNEAKNYLSVQINEKELAAIIVKNIQIFFQIMTADNIFNAETDKKVGEYFCAHVKKHEQSYYYMMLIWMIINQLSHFNQDTQKDQFARKLLDEWLLDKIVASVFLELGMESEDVWLFVVILKILVLQHEWDNTFASQKTKYYLILVKILNNSDVRHYLKVNRYQETLWFNQERFDSLCAWLFNICLLKSFILQDSGRKKTNNKYSECYKVIKKWQKMAMKSEFKLEELLKLAKDEE